MSNSLEREAEIKQDRRSNRLRLVCEGALEIAVAEHGREMTGFSVKSSPEDYLMTIRALTPDGKMICYVGASTLANLLLKAHREARADKLRWKADMWNN